MDKFNTKRRERMERMNFTADPTAKANFNKLKSFYLNALRKDVSTSLIVRRALAALVDHIYRLDGEKEISTELLMLLKQAG